MHAHEHISLTDANDSLISEMLLNKTTHYDWIIIITFYAALHKIDTLLHNRGIRSRDINGHTKKLDEVFNHLPQKIYNAYNTLYLESLRLRYKQTQIFSLNNQSLIECFRNWRKIKKFL